jgi:amino acid adenylation domain-containing protein
MKPIQTTRASEVIAELACLGAQLRIDGDHLRIRAPKGLLTPALRSEVAERKTELIAHLRNSESSRAASGFGPYREEAAGRKLDRHLPFPLTDIQQAYYAGREGNFALGNISCHTYYEVETENLDLKRLNAAWQRLIQRHEMLRAIFISHRQQQILEHVPHYEINLLDLRGQSQRRVAAQLQAIRQRMSHQVLPAGRWPLFEIRATRLEGSRMLLHFSFDLLIMDAMSMQLLFQEWRQLFRDPQTHLPPLEFSFRDYVLAENEHKNSPGYRRAKAYWLSRLAKIPPAPELPLAVLPVSVTSPRFARRSARLEPAGWERFKERAAFYGLTPSVVLLTAFSEVIATWSKRQRFSLNVTLTNRLPLHPQVNQVIGDFTAFIPLAIEHSVSDSFELRAGTLQGQLCEHLQRRSFNGVEIGRELMRTGGVESDFCFPVVFTSLLGQSRRRSEHSETFWMGKVRYGISQTPQVWLDHQVIEEDGALVFHWDVVEDIFPEGLIDEMFDAYTGLLQRLSDDGVFWQQPRPCLTPATQLELRLAINSVMAPAPDALLHELFLNQALERPEQPAIVSSNRVLNYEELRRRVSALAHELRIRGAKPNELIAIVMEKGWEQVVAALAILQSGAAYLPISAETPKSRLQTLIEDARARMVLTQSWLDQKIEWPTTVERISVDLESGHSANHLTLERAQCPDDLAYVIYTSGSTGKPKGVMISHRAAINTILDINRRFDVQFTDRVLALSSLSFDLSVYDIFGSLAAGATIVMPEPMAIRDPALLSKLTREERVTIWNSVPALMEMLVDYEELHRNGLSESLRLVMLSGDWIAVKLPERIRRLSDGIQVMSLGGATECSIWSILHQVKSLPPDAKSIPYGKALANQSVHVLDEFLNPCPVWVPGQLYIGGTGLALGYWRDKVKTEASFIVHPQTDARLYKTGDLGRFLPDGEIEFLGREDAQVKIRGYRIELGEIESALIEHPKVCAAALVAAGATAGERRLIAYVVLNADSAPAPNELREFLRQKLPEYMLPADFVFATSLPLTSNGKVDRRRLAELNLVSHVGEQSKVAPGDSPELRIERIVASVLERNGVEPNQNLLELGADSLDLVAIAGRMDREMGFRPQITDLYYQPTIAGLIGNYYRRPI